MEKRKIVMICQPMNGKTDEEIQKVRNEAKDKLEGLGYTVADSYFKEYNDERYRIMVTTNGITNIPILFLSQSIGIMSLCDAVYFCKGWMDARGCRIEHSVALEYGLEILED